MEKQQISGSSSRGATLVLSDGTRYRGVSFGAERSVGGECVFQTGMVGYVESLTDPSYRGQLLVLSYPLIGNYGAPPEDAVDEYGLSRFLESDQVHISALIVADYSAHYSHWNAQQSLGDWLKAHKVPAIHSIDTRALIKKIRETGSMLAKIVLDGDDEQAVELEDPNQRHLVAEVSRKQPQTYGSGSINVVAVDCGMKNNQVRCFLKRGVKVKVVPWDWPLLEEKDAHGFFLSNGPGDPTFCQKTIENVRALLARESAKEDPIPVFGICLGNQIMGLAAGAKTYKLKFGNRGHNQPCVDVNTQRCHLTSQNHGFAIDSATLPEGWQELFYNANDKTNEGIQHLTRPFFSCQFHPEAKGGPWDTEYLFDYFLAKITKKKVDLPMARAAPPKNENVLKDKLHKVLILGSGGLSIGQAGEFDYSGSQAIKALKQEHIQTILINPNIATVQTSPGLADKVYFLPVTPEFVIKLIEWERPDGILLTFGGQTALNCGIELYKQGVFEKYNVRVMGTPLEAIIATEDREVFAQELVKINEKIAPSVAARSLDEAIKAAEKIGYPVVVRAGFALGGLGSGFANDVDELRKLATMAFAQSEQVLVEKSLKGWKEIEYEVVRDAYDNCVTVCNMENFDPLGIHTGESIVVAPSQTLSDQDYFMLRDVAIRVVRHLGIVGECNIQYALNPDSEEYFIIEVNARLSRSSALASKATGYPLAFIAAKLALGVPLPSLRNSVTKTTTACWEPSLDYVVVKMPRWDLQKFQKVDGQIGTSMKSVGEVMAIGRTFEETIQKAIRMVNGSQWDGFQSGFAPACTDALTKPSSNRILVIAQALHEGLSVEEIHQLTKIDRWFLHKLKSLSDFEKTLRRLDGGLTYDMLAQAKRLGFADKQIAKFLNSTELVVRKMRKEFNIVPRIKQIDTVAAEFPAYNNYLYATYNGIEDDVETPGSAGAAAAAAVAPAVAPTGKADEAERPIIVLGSGAYCIGSSVEFDYCAVRCAQTLKKLGKTTIMINYNPETVSTDYDECDKLYFEELSFERVVDIYESELAAGIVVSMGGQIPNNMSMALGRQGVRILGTTPEMIESSENRFKFSRMLDLEGVDQPKWKDCTHLEETKRFCAEVGYPCLVRPSFVLSGAGMTVVNTPTELETYLSLASAIDTGKEQRVVISKFIMNAKEVDLDAVAQDGEIIALAISEHVENAGVHSGDATLILPAQDLDQVTVRKIEAAARKIAKQLQVSGPFNMQFIAKDNEIKVIECNLRASRSFPFVSKTLGIDFIELATKALLGLPLTPQPLPKVNHVGVKVPQFSFSRLPGADPVMGVEMASTGEVACFGNNKYEAYMKALLSTGFKLPKKRNIFLSLGPYKEKLEFLDSAQKLVNMGYNLFGTGGTADFLSEHSIPIKALSWDQEAEESNLETLSAHLSAAMIDLCIILPSNNRNRRPASFMSKGYMARRLAINYSVPLITNIKCAKLFIECLRVVPADIPIGLVDSRASSRTVILPGLIDVHVHVREPGASHKEDWDTCTAAALAGGITTICAMPNTNPEVIDAASMDLVTSIAKSKARCDYGIYFGASSDNAHVGPQFVNQAVALKMYLNQTFTRLRLDDMSTWMEHFTHWPKELPIVVHAEATTMAAALMVATLHDRALHIAHVCLKEELAVIRAAKEKGIRVTCEVCPHHLYLDKEHACEDHHLTDGRREVRPRLATQVDVEALWANMDIIDCIATDHAPHTLAEKDGPNPPPGFPGLETALPLMLTAVNQGRITLEDVIAKMYTNPKRIFNLPEQEDTYVVVNMDDKWTVPKAMAQSKCGWTPFAGMELQGRVVRVVLRGKTAMLDGTVYSLPGEGRNVCAAGAARPRPAAVAAVSAAAAPVVAIKPAIATPSPVAQRPQIAITPPTMRRVPSAVQPALAGAVELQPLVQAQAQVQQQQPKALAERRNSALSQEIFTHSGALPPRFTAKHVTSVKQFTRDDLRYLFSVAHDMRMMVKKTGSWDLLKGKVLANVFYEPSTRTSSSFHAAMLRLGGTVISVNETSSSVAKGESLPDTIRTLECYSDLIVLRHPQAGAAQLAASHARVPIINAGDGIGEHPTQALLDAFTIREELGTINGLRITMVGDLKNGRTVHSLVHLLSLYSIAQLNYVSPESLKMPSAILDELDKKGIPQREYRSLEEVLPHTDVLYVTRIQKERFASEEEYLAVRGTYVVTPEMLSHAKSNMVVMHPLPRVDEISPEIDSDPRAAYFRQMENGMYIRMALLATILNSNISS